MQPRHRPRSVHVLVGELLLHEHAPDCMEELADLLRAHDRFNQWCFSLKSKPGLRPGTTAEQFIKASAEHYETGFRALEAACDAYRASDWPKNREEVWKQTRESLRSAVVTYTRQLAELHTSYAAK
jgi:hypothetical protein